MEVPEAFLDPITFDAMTDPVITCDGHTYDRGSITRWLDTHNTSPRTGLILESRDLIPNHQLRQAIEEWYSAAGADWKIPWPEVEVGEQLSCGAYKTAYSGTWKGKNVALLQLRSGESHVECQVMHDLGQHPRLATFYGVARDNDDKEWIVMEMAHHGSLDDSLRRVLGGAQPSPHLVVAIGEQVAEAMECISLRGIVHRDLAARNVLAFDLHADGRRLDVRVSDFGLARECDYVCGSTDALPVRYMSPEAILQRNFSEKSDVWSFGVLLWELMTLEIPFAFAEDLEQTMKQVCQDGHRLEKPEWCPESLYGLMARCWAHDPSDRPSFKDLRGLLRDLALELHSVEAPVHAPVWRQFRDGINFERQCKNHACAACNQVVVIPCGFGDFDIGEDLPAARCPSCNCEGEGGEEERVWLQNCEWSWRGRMPRDANTHEDQGRCEGAPIMSTTHTQVWRSLKFAVKRID